ncbi:threonine synthase [Neisseria sp. Ec49-e6-T10]|uniref:threonine synthase n=1 Tax=Neisseria sp. Ec49-e6-T10 TaxID=3140744 RepID=UPI003EC0F1CE
MRYISTRGELPPQHFCDVLLMGLAPDGGLVMPEHYPQIDDATLAQWRQLSYADLAFEIMRLFITDINEKDLKQLVHKTYTAEIFGSTDITPVRSLNDGIIIQALSNGPTLAFKDMAMQFLGNIFEYVLEKKSAQLNILGATSGDTGSAAEYAMRGKKGINVFMLSPNGKMSAFQRAQMYSLQDKNIYNIAVEGLFDDCQDIVKAVQNDAQFKNTYKIGTVNSINWARIVAQVVYYFKGYLASTNNNQEKVSFCVPSGNFGNICAGHIAKQMGLPIDRLIVATNENDVLDEFFKTGHYTPRGTDKTYITSSPSMDISKASNFERFIFDLSGKNPEKIKTLWKQVDAKTGFNYAEKLDSIHNQFGFTSGKSTHADRLKTIAQVYAQDKQLIDPHTADGVKVAREVRKPNEKIICLETALAIKFEETIKEAIDSSVHIPVPTPLEGIEQLPQKVSIIQNDANLVKSFIQNALAS